MILKSLSLSNIRSYTDAIIHFPSGSILLAGDIGSGKSTILQAIEFALFGIMRGDLEASALLRSGTNKGNVALTFTLGNKEITIIRTLIKGKQAITQDTGALILDGVEEKLTATELRRRMIEILAYPQALATKSPTLIFRYTVYTSQEQMKEILAQTPQERLQTLRAVFGIDNYSKIKENAIIIARGARERIAYLEGQLTNEPVVLSQLEQTKTQQQLLLKKHAEALTQQELAKKQFAQTEKDYELLKQTIAALISVSSTANHIKNEIQVLKSQEVDFNQRIKNSKAQQDSFKLELAQTGTITIDLETEQTLLLEKRQVYAKVQTIQDNLQIITARLASVQAKIENAVKLEKKREELQAQFNQILEKESSLQLQSKELSGSQIEMDKINEQIMQMTAAHAAASIERERLTTQIDHTHESGICDLCMQTVTPQQQELSKEQKKQRLAQVMEAIGVGAKELEDLDLKKRTILKSLLIFQETLTSLAQIQGKRQAIEQELVSAKSDKDELTGHLTLIEAEHTQIREQAMQLGTQLTAIDTQLETVRLQKEKSLKLMQYEQRILDLQLQITQQDTDLSNTTKRIVSRQVELAKLQAQISSLDSLKAQEQQANSKRLALRIQEEEASQLAARAQALFSASKTSVIQLQEQLDKISHVKTQLETVNIQKQWIQTYFSNVMDIIEQHVFSTVHADFNSHFQKWLMMLLEDQAINVSLDTTLSPQVRQNGYDVSVSQLSGGEKTSVALAYRLALNRVISDVFATIKTKNLLILDEPTDGFSEEQLDRVRDVLTALPTGQLIIVSHEPKVETFVDHVVRIKKENHTSLILSAN